MTIILIIAAILALVALYEMGYIPFSSKAATIYVDLHRGKQVRFKNCNGTVRRMIRLRNGGTYAFRLDSEVAAGTVTISLTKRGAKDAVLVLDASTPSGTITADEGSRYCMHVRFANATGSYRLTWNHAEGK